MRFAAIALAGLWLARTWSLVRRFKRRSFEEASAKMSAKRVSQVLGGAGSAPEVTFDPSGLRIVAKPGASLLELCESAECLAVPVRVASLLSREDVA